jgi:hypothetical protein
VLGKETLTSCEFLSFCGFFKNGCSTNILVLTGQQHQSNIVVQYKENQYVSSTVPIRLNEAYSICWSGAEMELHVFQDGGHFQRKKNVDHHKGS